MSNGKVDGVTGKPTSRKRKRKLDLLRPERIILADTGPRVTSESKSPLANLGDRVDEIDHALELEGPRDLKE
eukprot:CAMPEP_0184489512 /NCGR_PEP_ID=MMETSP0113_2-20130426/15674_1 /TAXON_ID=91329 /ORGANISM="Norrisiella sphaerica, Strain BC52" /LENGTH=71 /DNA_ID=CAMNT_0026872989 /DNA_START=89 /DNA_END=301 /DNA_ORIENTATION=-